MLPFCAYLTMPSVKKRQINIINVTSWIIVVTGSISVVLFNFFANIKVCFSPIKSFNNFTIKYGYFSAVFTQKWR